MASLIAQWIATGNKPKFREIEISKTYNHSYRLVVGYLRCNAIIFNEFPPIIKQLLLYYSIPLTIKDMGKHAFYRWVSECAPNGVASNAIDEMVYYIQANKIDGTQITGHCRSKTVTSLLTNVPKRSIREFLSFITHQIMKDWEEKTIIFDDYTATQFATYIKAQSTRFVSETFKSHGYDGPKYIDQCYTMLAFLTKNCGFDMQAANAFMDAIDRYPQRPIVTPTPCETKTADDEIVSDSNTNTTKMNLHSKSYGFRSNNVEKTRKHSKVADSVQKFAKYAIAVYRENDTDHWKHIRTRLKEYGGCHKLFTILTSENKVSDRQRKRQFVKAAKSIYKIDCNEFYNLLVEDAVTRLKWSRTESTPSYHHLTNWMVEYERVKLAQVIQNHRMNMKTFKKDQNSFGRWFKFLPKKQRKALYKELKKAVSQGSSFSFDLQ